MAEKPIKKSTTFVKGMKVISGLKSSGSTWVAMTPGYKVKVRANTYPALMRKIRKADQSKYIYAKVPKSHTICVM